MDKEKKIDVGSSSLVDLKAELHRKQQESRSLRAGSDRPSKCFAKPKIRPANTSVEKGAQRDNEEGSRDTEDLDSSRMALEAKALLYDKLHTGTEALEDDATNERFLVNFQQKIIDDVTQRRQRRQAAGEDSASERPTQPVSTEDEWVEYTDSLGRSRTVMRKDLAEYRRRDSLTGDRGQLAIDRPSQGADRELAPKDERREQQRQLWEQQEQDNAAKRDIHYQDVLFNEARSHGAGYFAFSQDAEERARQRAELDELRERTETQQSRAQLARKRKNKQLKERLRKVRERKRLKLGLPIEDRLEKEESEEEQEAAPPAPPEPTPEALKQKEEDAKKEEERQKFIREWDLGKEGVSKKPLLTQEQWVEQQRKERPAEFAPPVQYEPRVRGRGRAQAWDGGAADTDRTPADEAGVCRRMGQESAAGDTRRPPPGVQQGAAGQASSSVGQRASGMRHVTPDAGSVPLMCQAPPNVEHRPPNVGHMPPSVRHMNLSMMYYPPPMEQTPLSKNRMPPNMGTMPINMNQSPCNMGSFPPDLRQIPPNLEHPPSVSPRFPLHPGRFPCDGRQASPGGGTPPSTVTSRTLVEARSKGDKPGSAQSDTAGGPAPVRRPASYRARQAAAADLTDPDCLPPEQSEAARGAGTEVAPPLTAEYFGGARPGRRQPVARPDVGGAIEAGLALLSQDTEKKHSKTFDL